MLRGWGFRAWGLGVDGLELRAMYLDLQSLGNMIMWRGLGTP